MSDFDYMDDEEKKEYHNEYMQSMRDFTESMEEGDRDDIFRTMEGIKYNPTDNPRQDAELNYLRSRKIVSSKKRKLGQSGSGAVNSLLKFKQRADSMTPGQINKWVGKSLKED